MMIITDEQKVANTLNDFFSSMAMLNKLITPLFIQDAPHSRHSYRSHTYQSIGYNKESSNLYLHDPKEHKDKRDLCGNCLKF